MELEVFPSPKYHNQPVASEEPSVNWTINPESAKLKAATVFWQLDPNTVTESHKVSELQGLVVIKQT